MTPQTIPAAGAAALQEIARSDRSVTSRGRDRRGSRRVLLAPPAGGRQGRAAARSRPARIIRIVRRAYDDAIFSGSSPPSHQQDAEPAVDEGHHRRGEHRETGKYLWPTEYAGTGGVTLEDIWAEQGATAYLGMTVPGFPNLFMLYGPNSQPVSGGAGLVGWFEIWSGYIARAIALMTEGGRRRMEVRKDVHDEYNERLQEEARSMVYLTDAGSRDKNYYVNEWGRLQVNFPWEAEDFFQLSAVPNLEDFTLT